MDDQRLAKIRAVPSAKSATRSDTWKQHSKVQHGARSGFRQKGLLYKSMDAARERYTAVTRGLVTACQAQTPFTSGPEWRERAPSALRN